MITDRSLGVCIIFCAIGLPKAEESVRPFSDKREECEASNAKLLADLKEDKFSKELYDQTCADAELSRMTPPERATDCNLHTVRLSPRFGVEQFKRPDGSIKVRCDLVHSMMSFINLL